VTMTPAQIEARIDALAGLRVEIDRQVAVRRRAIARAGVSEQTRTRLASDVKVREELRAQVVAEIGRLENALARVRDLIHGAPKPLHELLAAAAAAFPDDPERTTP